MFDQLELMASQRAERAVQGVQDAEAQFQRLAYRMAMDTGMVSPKEADAVLAETGRSVSELQAAVEYQSRQIDGRRFAQELPQLRSRRQTLMDKFGAAEEEFKALEAKYEESQLELVGRIRPIDEKIELAEEWLHPERKQTGGSGDGSSRNLAAAAPKPTELQTVVGRLRALHQREMALEAEMGANAETVRSLIARMNELGEAAAPSEADADEAAAENSTTGLTLESSEVMLEASADDSADEVEVASV